MTPKLHEIAVEVSAELWTAAVAKSRLTREDLSEVISRGIENYIQEES